MKLALFVLCVMSTFLSTFAHNVIESDRVLQPGTPYWIECIERLTANIQNLQLSLVGFIDLKSYSCFENLEKTVETLEEKLEELMEMNNDHMINHYIYPGNRLGMTYNDAELFCIWHNQVLCSLAEMFPNGDNLPAIIGVLEGDMFAPVRDSYNDWAQVGQKPGRTGQLHNSFYSPPTWGNGFFRTDLGPIKGNILCCPMP